MSISRNDDLEHSGVKGMRWGVRNGPPYPLQKQHSMADVRNVQNELKSFRYKNYDSLMHPSQVAKEKRGSCHDQSLYAYTRLKGLGFDPHIKFLIETDSEGRGGTTHSFCWFTVNGFVYWLENAWEPNKGLHRYKTEKDMMDHVKAVWEKNSEFPELETGDARPQQWRPGMDLGDLLNTVRWNR